MKTEPNDSAHPIVLDHAEQDYSNGLTKREYFAVMFTAAFIQSPGNHQPNWVDDNAKIGLQQADALIAELNK